ncbi:hypothetical protein PENTCL1PPCAC_10934, partial [Pristionchus entomophagus]
SKHLLHFSKILFNAIQSEKTEEDIESIIYDRNVDLNICQTFSLNIEHHLTMQIRIDRTESPTAEYDATAAADAASTISEDSIVCCICFDAISEKKRSVKFDCCSHIFHHFCATSWFVSLQLRSMREGSEVPTTCCTCRAIVSEMIGEDELMIPITYPFEEGMTEVPF